MKLFCVLALALFMVGSVVAFECNGLSADCNDVKASNLSNSEKDLVISTLIYNADQPDHDLIRDWNLGLKVKNAPDGVTTYDAGYIRHAWLRIFSVMPSVLYNGSLYAPTNTSVQTEFNYSVELPSGPQPGDCLTIYGVVNNNADLKVYLNNVLVGTNKIQSLKLSSDAIVESDVSIAVDTNIHHYQWYSWCCVPWHWGCAQMCTDCREQSVETKKDRLQLIDWILLRQYALKQLFQFNVTDKYYGVTKAELDIENYSSFQLSTNNANYTKNYYYYDLNWTYSPYNALTIEAHDHENERTDNLIIQNNASNYDFTLHDTRDCKITTYDFFSNKTTPCNLEYFQSNSTQKIENKTDFEKYVQPLLIISIGLSLYYVLISAAKKIKLN